MSIFTISEGGSTVRVTLVKQAAKSACMRGVSFMKNGNYTCMKEMTLHVWSAHCIYNIIHIYIYIYLTCISNAM